mmetsp:Transcript_25282/g.79926  ORF Transcript_25282/g.79926 Transcript_25282/m.79926 type:complete len:269 (+) Transcript_25282:425-1231(+)
MGSLLLILFLVVPRGSSLVRHDEVGAPFTAPGADLGGRAHGMRCPRGGRPLWMTSRCRADGRDGHGPLPEQDDGGSWGREDASEEHETHGEVLQAGDGGDGDGGWYGQFGHDGRGNAHPPPCHAHAGEGSHGSISPRRERGRQCWRDHWQGCGEDDCEERAHEHGGRGPAQLSGKDRGPRHRRWGLWYVPRESKRSPPRRPPASCAVEDPNRTRPGASMRARLAPDGLARTQCNPRARTSTANEHITPTAGARTARASRGASPPCLSR